MDATVGGFRFLACLVAISCRVLAYPVGDSKPRCGSGVVLFPVHVGHGPPAGILPSLAGQKSSKGEGTSVPQATVRR